MKRVRAGHSCDPFALQVRLLIACLSMLFYQPLSTIASSLSSFGLCSVLVLETPPASRRAGADRSRTTQYRTLLQSQPLLLVALHPRMH